MAKISTYPLEGNPKLSDKLIGTSVGLNQIGNLENPTYNFSLQQLLDLFSPLLPGNTLQGVLDNNNTATEDINLFGKITTTDLEVTNIANIFSAYISDSIYLEGELFDINNSQGTAGQILTSTGNGVEWLTLSNITPTLQEVLTSGNEADVDIILTANITAEGINADSILVQDSFRLGGTFLDSVGATGTSGQMLISLGTGVLWQDVPVYTASSPLFINPATKNITIQQANGTQNGYLSFADWITFNGKQNALSGTGLVLSNGGIISYITDNSFNWNRAYNDSIVSAAVTGTTTKTLTLTQRDGDTITASWVEGGGGGGISSIGLTMPAAFTVTNSPLTSNGVIAVAAAGDASQYIKGDGTLGTLPSTATFVPYTGANANVNLGIYNITANSIIKNGGTSSQFLKADGSIDSTTYFPTPTGLASQYVRGDGTLANFPTSTGGGSSFNYYLNGSISQGTFGGDTYYQMSRTPILGAGTNFTRTNGQGNGYIASFITDAGDPSLLNIPGGNWNVEFYFQSSASGGSPQFYAEIYKVSATNVFTLIASGSVNPEGITNGTTVDQYFTSIPVPQTSLLTTDRIAIRIYVITGGRTITLHTENGNLCEVITTFSTGLTALNGLTAQVQYLDVGTTGTDFNISSATDTHTFNLPTASALNRGALSSADWTTFNSKFTLPALTSGSVLFSNGTTIAQDNANLFWDNINNRLVIGFDTPINNSRLLVAGDDYQITLASTNGLTGIFCTDQSAPMISFDNTNWKAFNNAFQYNVSGDYFSLKKIIISDLGNSTILGTEKMPNGNFSTNAAEETLIGVYDNTTTYWETGIYAKRNIYCGAGGATDLLLIASPNSTVDCVVKIGYGDKYFIAKLSLIIDWTTQKYTYKIIYTNTTNFDNAAFVNDINFTFDFPPIIGSTPFAIKLNNNTGDDIYANINANIL